jgi:hypothetical protein
MASSTAQNSGSKAIEVAWPDSWTERFLKVAMCKHVVRFGPAGKSVRQS